MKLKHCCRPDRDVTFASSDVSKGTMPYTVKGLGVATFYSKVKHGNRYYNVGNHAYWLESD